MGMDKFRHTIYNNASCREAPQNPSARQCCRPRDQKTANWQRHFQWHIHFWGAWNNVRPRFGIFQVPHFNTWNLNLGASQARNANGPPHD